MTYEWKILEVKADNGLITEAKYFVSSGLVSTEGYWKFKNPVMNKPFDEVKQTDIISWIDHESAQAITCRLDEQEQQHPFETTLPWMKHAFTPFKE